MTSLKRAGLLIFAFCREGLDKATAMCWTGLIAGTLAWGLMPDGFWDKVLKYIYIGSGFGFIWVFSPLLFYTAKYAYLDWKTTK